MHGSQHLSYAVGRVRRRSLAVFASGYAIVVATGLLQHVRTAVVYLDGHLLVAPIGGFPDALEHSHMQGAVRARQPVQLCDNGVCVHVIRKPALHVACGLSTEYPTPQRAARCSAAPASEGFWGLLTAFGTWPGLCPPRLLLDGLRRFSRLLW